MNNKIEEFMCKKCYNPVKAGKNYYMTMGEYFCCFECADEWSYLHNPGLVVKDDSA